MLRTPIPNEVFGDLVRRLFAALITMRHKLVRVALSGDDIADNGHSPMSDCRLGPKLRQDSLFSKSKTYEKNAAVVRGGAQTSSILHVAPASRHIFTY
ncbi:MAG: hypothetical protein GY854_11880 [Deltaproteobacteria bacterium]|nr:hypothetical protein [Deltaproteobacteria bacterium]